MEMNSTTISIAAIVIGLLVCYYIWKEVKRTQGEVSNLKAFTGKVASYIESSHAPVKQTEPPQQCVMTKKSREPASTPETIPEENEEITE